MSAPEGTERCCICATRAPIACGVCLGVSQLDTDVTWFVRRMNALHATVAELRAQLEARTPAPMLAEAGPDERPRVCFLCGRPASCSLRGRYFCTECLPRETSAAERESSSCPTCGAEPGQRCRATPDELDAASLNEGRVYVEHERRARVDSPADLAPVDVAAALVRARLGL